MASNQYREYELIFLQELAKTIKFSNDEYRTIFLNSCLLEFRERFTTRAKMARDSDFITRIYAKEYDEETSKIIGDSLREKFSVINRQVEATLKEKAEEQGINFEEFPKNNKWQAIMSYLETEYFNVWLEDNKERIEENKISSSDYRLDGWRQLWNSAKYGSIVVKNYDVPSENTLDINTEKWKKKKIYRFPWKTQLYYQIETKVAGYFILIQKFASGNIWCFAPSTLIRDFKKYSGVHRFPDLINAENDPCIEVEAGITGLERVLVIVTQNKPDFDWLPTNEDIPEQIDETILEDLVNFISQEEEFEIIKTEYMVVASN